MSNTQAALPPLPEPTRMSQIVSRHELEFTADQMRAYGEACARAALAQAEAAQPADPAEPLKGWKLNHARPGEEEGTAEIGYLDPEDDRFARIVTVDTGLYYQGEQAMPLAVAILGMLEDTQRAAPQPAEAAPKQEAHADDAAVDAFAAAMKEKLALARAKGRSGWQTCRPESLSEMLRDHVEKGDPRDVANFCMFLWSLGAGITAPLPGSEAFDRWVNAGMGVRREAAPKQEAAAHWRDLARKFDAQRMQAMWHLQAMLQDAETHAPRVREFLSAQPQQPAPEPVARVPLTDDALLKIAREHAGGTTIKLTRDVGPYEVTEPTHVYRLIARAIERATASAPEP